MKIKKLFVIIITILTVAALFFFLSAFYLEYQAKNNSPASKEKTDEPYTQTPANAGILFKFEGDENCFIYLDFSHSSCFAVITDKTAARIKDRAVDYTVNADYRLIAGIIDRLGGIELAKDGEEYRYTGLQVTELLSLSPGDYFLKRDILEKIFEKISKNGFSKDDFVYIIKNTGSDLLVPDCLFWDEFMPVISENFEVIS